MLVDGRSRPKNHRLRGGEAVRVEIPQAVPYAAQPEAIPLDIVYEDSDLLVVNKPKGMVVHPAAGNYTGTLVNALLAHCGDSLSGIGGVLRPGIVHRIDTVLHGNMKRWWWDISAMRPVRWTRRSADIRPTGKR